MRTTIKGLVAFLIFSTLAPVAEVFAAPSGPPPPPSLSISLQSGNQVTINWQDTNDWLQASPALDRQSVPFSWSNVGTAPGNSVTLPADQPVQFFRLVVSPGAPPPTELILQDLNDTLGDYYFELDWDEVTGAASYNVYMATAPGVSSQNYSSLPGGMKISGITNIYADVPDVPDGVYTPSLAANTTYYFVVTAVAANGMESADSNPASGMVGPMGELEGKVFANLNIGGSPTTVFLPGVHLTLVNSDIPALSNNAVSDINGDFDFSAMPAGSYNLCWNAAGYLSACSNEIALGGGSYSTGAIQLFPEGGTGMLYGNVRFQDGSPAYDVNSVFGVNVQPLVVLRSNQTVVATAPVNSLGRYAMANVPQSANLQLSVTVENETVVSNVNTFNVGEADLILPSAPPQIQSVVATSNGIPVYNVAPGTTVQVTVTATGQNLNYEWYDTNGLTSLPDSSNISWTIPANATGYQYLWARVNDGDGGYAEQRVELAIIPFAFMDGVVVGSDTGAPVPGALVQLNGMQTTADTNGYFYFQLPFASQYNLDLGANGYASMSRTYLDPVSDNTYVLMAITPPQGPFCPSPPALAVSRPQLQSNPGNPTEIWVTNCDNGIYASIPVGGLLDQSNNPYYGCFSVSLDALDPCDPASGFASGNLETNNAPLQPYSLINIEVTDDLNNPLHLAPGAIANVFAPIASSCMDTNATPPDATAYAQTNDDDNEWSTVGGGNFTYNTSCGVGGGGGGGGYPGYYGQSSSVGMLCWGAPPAPATLGPVIVRFIVDNSLHIPLTIGYFLDDNGKPGKQWGDWQIIYHDLEGVRFWGLTPNQVIWFKVLNLRQSPGNYYGSGNATFLPTAQKDVIQVEKFTAPAATPATEITNNLGLGVDVDKPIVISRSATLLGIPASSMKSLGESFLVKRYAEANYDPEKDYYNRIDPAGKKKNFAAWQLANGWPKAGLAPVGGANGYGLYFNANDLGAGRRTGMNIFTEGEGTNKGQSVAYYVATYPTLAGAVQDQQNGVVNVPADTSKTGNLKYVVCMEYSLSYDASGKVLDGGRYIKFYAFGADGIRTGIVPNESRSLDLAVPYLCMNCHGGTGITLHELNPTNKYGDVKGQFVPFDVANYTFATAFPPNSGLNSGQFTKLNQGLLIGQAKMPQKTLVPLLKKLIANNNYTTDSSGLPSWGATPGSPTDAETSLYNNVYAISCRSCHVTQCLDTDATAEAAYNFTTAASFMMDTGNMIGAVPGGTLQSNPNMPHAQRTFGIFWGSSTARQLQDTTVIKLIPGIPAVNSQPAQIYDVQNSDYFTKPVK